LTLWTFADVRVPPPPADPSEIIERRRERNETVYYVHYLDCGSPGGAWPWACRAQWACAWGALWGGGTPAGTCGARPPLAEAEPPPAACPLPPPCGAGDKRLDEWVSIDKLSVAPRASLARADTLPALGLGGPG
jgi:hypothetical protein